MNPQLTDLLREIEDGSQRHGGTPRIARESGQFLNILVKAMGARNILEIGTADGYATLWLAEAVAANEGQVTTLAPDVWKGELAKKILTRSPHAERIHLLQGDIQQLLAVLEGPFDFVLLDGDRTQALQYLHLIVEKISSGAVICVDKAISEAGKMADYLTYVHERPGLESILVPIGEGVELTYKAP